MNSSLSKKRKLIFGIVLTVSLIGIVSLAIYADLIISSEFLYPCPGTYAYFVSIPATIKNLPQPQLIGKVTYYHSQSTLFKTRV